MNNKIWERSPISLILPVAEISQKVVGIPVIWMNLREIIKAYFETLLQNIRLY